VPSIAAQVDSYPVRARKLAYHGRVDRIGLYVAPRLSHRRDMIYVYAKMYHNIFLWVGWLLNNDSVIK
jgi:hypothetical protein